MLPPSIARYVGIPFADHGTDWTGTSCWGLVTLFYREERQIILPTYDEGYVTATDRREIAALFRSGIAPDWALTSTPQVGDVVLFRIGGQPLHCGLWLTPEQFLHCERGTETCISRFHHPKWRGRLLGVYRYMAVPTYA